MRALLCCTVLSLVAGCADTRTDQERRESMVLSCINLGGNPVDCASAADTTIPRAVLRRTGE